MNGNENGILAEMNALMSELESHFCAFGVLDEQSRILRWRLAAGNVSDKFQYIEDRAGKGLSGSVIKVGRPMSLHVTELIMNRQLHEYPMLLSEKLRSAYAVPLLDGVKVTGLLLIGDRVKRIYRPDDRSRAAAAGERIARFMQEETAGTQTSG